MTLFQPERRHCEVLKIVGIYALVGGLWIYFSDSFLEWLVQDAHIMAKIAMVKGLAFIAFTASLLYVIINRYARRLTRINSKLRESELAYRTLFDQNPGIVTLNRITGEFVDVNTHFLTSLGLERSEVIGRHDSEVVEIEGREQLMNRMVWNGGQISRFETRIHVPGSRQWYDVLLSTRLVTVNEEAMVLSIVHDVTEQKKAEAALIQRERVLDSLLAATPAGVALLKDRVFLRVNAALCRMTGYPQEEMLGMTTRLLFTDEEEYLRVGRELYTQLERDGLGIREAVLQRKDGSLIDVMLSISPLDPHDHSAGVCSAVLDITELKNTERALRVSGAQLRATLENTPNVAIQWFDDEGKIRYWNPASEALYGLRSSEVLGRSLHEFTKASRWRERFLSTLEGVRATGKPAGPYEVAIPKRDGSTVWVLTTVFPIPMGEGRTGAACMVVDMTERRRIEEAMHASEERARLIAENAKVVIWLMDMDLQYSYMSPYVERYTGYTPEEIMRKPLNEVMTASSLENLMQLLARELEEEKKPDRDLSRSRTVEVEHVHRDGRVLESEMNMTFVRDHKGNATGILGITSDITERKRQEAERKKLEAQLAQAQKMESIGTLAGGIAHDFNNILSAIIGYSELALDDVPKDPARARREIGEVLKASQRASALVRQILTFSRKTEIVLSPLDVPPMVKESLKMLRSAIPSTVEIRQHLVTSALVKTDPTQIHQLMMNLCTNAAHAIDETGGILSVSLRNVHLDDGQARDLELPAGPYALLSVSDTGHGMTPEVMERIFEPYFTTKELGRGTGLGLSVVHGIVKGHGGAIVCRSEPGKGTTFDVYLPAIELRSTDDAVREEGQIPGGSERILLVDDEPALMDLAGRMLGKLGYRTVTKTSSIEALEHFRSDPDAYDLVITDMTMPGLTGDKLARSILELRPDMPVIICTGYSEHISEEKARSIGVRELVMKPIILSSLARTIREVLDGKLAPASSSS
jgi:PAS domain S-box-containing protein